MESIFDMIVALLKNADWSAIMVIFAQTIDTIKRIIGAA